MSAQHAHQNLFPQSDPYLEITVEAYRELLRQTRQTFNCQVFSIVVSIVVLLVGCGLPFVGYPTEGVLMAIAGGGTSGFCNRLAKESQRKLERLVREVKSLRLS